MKKLRENWIVLGGISMTLIGAGLCFAIEAAFIKHSNPEGAGWILFGTGALIVFNTGLGIMGEAIFIRIRKDIHKKESSQTKIYH